MKYIKLFESFESIDIPYLMSNNFEKDRFYKTLETDDFMIKFDEITGDSLTIDWIYNISNKIRGIDIFKGIIEYCNKKNYDSIHAYGIRGLGYVNDDKQSVGVETNGYYTMMRWGFVPKNGVKDINKILKTKYKSIDDMYLDQNFWTKWKKDVNDYAGVFDLNKNSLSYKILNHEI